VSSVVEEAMDRERKQVSSCDVGMKGADYDSFSSGQGCRVPRALTLRSPRVTQKGPDGRGWGL